MVFPSASHLIRFRVLVGDLRVPVWFGEIRSPTRFAPALRWPVARHRERQSSGKSYSASKRHTNSNAASAQRQFPKGPSALLAPPNAVHVQGNARPRRTLPLIHSAFDFLCQAKKPDADLPCGRVVGGVGASLCGLDHSGASDTPTETAAAHFLRSDPLALCACLGQ